MMQVRIIIAGSRDFNDYTYLARCMNGVKVTHQHDVIQIVSGGARGADELGEQWAREQGLPLEVRDADWKRLGRRAGLIRNEEMAATSNVLCAFWDGHSRGTRHMIGAAFRNHLEVHVFPFADSVTGDLFDG